MNELHRYRGPSEIHATSETTSEKTEGLLWESCCHCGRRWEIYSSVPARLAELRTKDLDELREACFGPESTGGVEEFQETYEGEFFEPAFAAFRKQGCEYFGVDCEAQVIL